MSDNGQQMPLIERLRRVPAAARVLEHTPNPLGYDTTIIPVGALCREAADRIAELTRGEGAADRGADAEGGDMSMPWIVLLVAIATPVLLVLALILWMFIDRHYR